MTMQLPDRFTVFGQGYDLVATTDDYFCPGDYGLTRRGTNSACWRGYRCCIEVDRDRGLMLQELAITASGNTDVLLGGKAMTREADWLDGVYKEVELMLPFTGRMLFGRHQRYTIGSYLWEAAWGYATLLEVSFENGRVVGTKDYSRQARRFQRLYRISGKLQRRTEQYDYEDGTGDLSVKMWWLDRVPSPFLSACLIPVDGLLRLWQRIAAWCGRLLAAHWTRVEKRHKRNDSQYTESKFIFAQRGLENVRVSRALRSILIKPEQKRVMVISPEAYCSGMVEWRYQEQLESLGFSPKNIAFATRQNTRRRSLYKYDYLYLPNGDPFALRGLICTRLLCKDRLLGAIHRGAVCIATGEAAMACGDSIRLEDTRHRRSCHRLSKADTLPMGLHLFPGTVWLSEREKPAEKDPVIDRVLPWDDRVLYLNRAVLCCVDGDSRRYVEQQHDVESYF